MSTRAGAARARGAPARDQRPRARQRPRAVRSAPRRSARRAPAVRPAMILIPLIALLLAGMVWVNVAKLNVTNHTGQVIERSREVQFETARLRADLAQRDGAVADRAAGRLGMVQGSSEGTIYLDLSPQDRAGTRP